MNNKAAPQGLLFTADRIHQILESSLSDHPELPELLQCQSNLIRTTIALMQITEELIESMALMPLSDAKKAKIEKAQELISFLRN